MQPMIQEPGSGSVKDGNDRLAAAIAGNYSFSIKAIFDEAWEKTKGFKTMYWGALGVVVLLGLLFLIGTMSIVAAVGMFMGVVNESGDLLLGSPLEKILQVPLPMLLASIPLIVLGLILVMPMVAGLWMIAIRHSAGQPVHIKMVFACYQNILRYFWVTLWTSLLSNLARFLTGLFVSYLALHAGTSFAWVGVALGVILQAYIYLIYFLSFPLMADKGLGAWQALEASRKAVSQHLYLVFGAVFIISTVCFVIPGFLISLMFVGAVHPGMAILGIIFIWLIPFYGLEIGILYREIFGLSSKA